MDEYDDERIDEAVLALMYLNGVEEHGAVRAWKSYPWDSTDRLHEAGLISEPAKKVKSVLMTDAGHERAKRAAAKLFGKSNA